jgi:hypothetical protein
LISRPFLEALPRLSLALPRLAQKSLALVALGLCAHCSPATPPTAVVVNNEVNVSVTTHGGQGEVPPTIDLNDPRIGVAQREIARLLGHPLNFEVDPTLVPNFDQQFHDAFVAALETSVTSLQYCKEHIPHAFAYAAAHFKTLRWKYSASKRVERPELDVGAGLLEVWVPPNEWQLLEDSTLFGVFERALDRDRVLRYSDLSAEKIPPAEHAGYLEFLTDYRKPTPDKDGRVPSSEEVQLRQTRQLIALYPLLQDAALKKKLREHLGYAGSRFQRALYEPPEDPKERALGIQVHGLWIAWLNRYRDDLSRSEQERVAELMYRRSYADTPQMRKGFDGWGFALPFVRQWTKRMLEVPPPRHKPEHGIQDQLACPFNRDSYSQSFTSTSYCNGALYIDVLRTPSGSKKLAQILLREKSPALTQAAVLHTLNVLGAEAVPSLLDAVATDDAAFKAALVALADFAGWGPAKSRSDGPALVPAPLLERIPEWWQKYPGRRPQLLYLLTNLGEDYEGSITWPKLAEFLGAKISAEELTGFMQQNPNTLWSLRNLASALSEGWKRSTVLIPQLEIWLNAHNASGGRGTQPYYVAERSVELFCLAGTAEDIRALQRFLKQRLESHPSERRNLGSFAEAKMSELCPKFGAKRGGASGNEPLFGD